MHRKAGLKDGPFIFIHTLRTSGAKRMMPCYEPILRPHRSHRNVHEPAYVIPACPHVAFEMSAPFSLLEQRPREYPLVDGTHSTEIYRNNVA